MNNGSSRPFDEQAALERGKRLQEQIYEARRRRQRAVEEFDAFLRENQRTIRETSVANREMPAGPPGAVASAPAVPTPAAPAPVPGGTPQTPPAPASTPGGDAQPPADPAPTPEQSLFSGAQSALDRAPSPPSSTFNPPAGIEPATMPVPSAARDPVRGKTSQPDIARLVRRGVAVAAPIILLVAAMMISRSWTPARDTAKDGATPPAAEQAAAPQTAAPQAPTPPSAAPAPRPGLELTTTRPAWVRVTVDDRVVVERELAAGQHLQFDFTRAVTVRAGDAGAIRLTAAGRDLGVMGPAGQIRTRTITASGSGQ